MSVSDKEPNPNIVVAHEPDRSLKDLVGRTTAMSDIFSEEKIAACQKLVDNARDAFFDIAKADMDAITALTAHEATPANYSALRKGLFKPVSNIKGQAELFDFRLICRVCQYLMEYCVNPPAAKERQGRDIFIVARLVEVLQKAFRERIMDSGGAIEKDLVAIVELARK